jgi:hypothetical protein
MKQATYSTAIQRCDIKEAKNYGKFYIVGTIPLTCYDQEKGKSMVFNDELEALQSILDDPWIQENPSHPIQRANCSKVVRLA